MFGYAEIGASQGASAAARQYAASLASGHASIESSVDCFGSSRDTASSNLTTVFVEGRPFWSDDGSASATSASIIEAYLREGRAFLARLNGSFAIALFDRRAHELTLAIDRMGIEALAWTADAAHIVFSTSARHVAYRPDANVAIRPQAIYDYFFFHMVPSPHTVFSGVQKLEAGTAVVFTPTCHREERYWTPDFSRAGRTSFGDLKAAARDALKAAVQRHYAGSTTGAFLSGGLDSSSVTGYLAQVSSGPAQTFSMGFGVDSFDELEYARITNRHFGCSSHEYNVTPEDILRAIPIAAAAFDEPFGNSSAIPTYACAKHAKEFGISRLLAGDGGDEIFAGNERYARHQLFEYFNRVSAPLRNPLTALVHRMVSNEHPVAAIRKLRSFVDQASIPLPERYESWNFVYREGRSIMFTDDFMGTVDVDRPMQEMREIFQSTPSTDLLDRMLYYDWKFTLADNDLRKVTTMCIAAGVDVAFPMLDNRVVEASINVPSDLKMARLELRTFFKRAMRGFLPEQVLKKQKHGFGLPFGQWLKTHAPLADMVYASLADLKRRSIIKPSFIEQLIDGHQRGDAGYYGYVIWDLVMLEEWFKGQAPQMRMTAGTS